MRQLRFTAVHEDGQHLVLTDPGDGEEYLVEIDERLRDVVRGRRSGIGEHPAEALTPRTVQAMMRAGESAEEVAAATGWPVDRVRRYEGPIVAEREHVARLAQRCEVRGRAADGTERPTMESRVRERLTARGVDPDLARWDASRPEGGRWTVLVGFVAGNRERRAAWRFDPAARHLEALDDEARWLSEDEQALPGGAGGYAGLGGDGSGAVDLVATMRRRSRARGRRRGRTGAAEEDPAAVPGREEVPEDLLPLEELRYDPATMGLPPSAHGRPGEDLQAEGATESEGPPESQEEDFAAEAPVEMTGPTDIAEAPAPDTEGEHDGAEEARDEEEDRSPQEATLEDFFGDDLDEAENEDTDEDDERPPEDEEEAATEQVRLELEGDLEPEPEPGSEPETAQSEAAEPEEASPREQAPDEVSRPHQDEDAGPALVAVADPEDVEDEPAEPAGPAEGTEPAKSSEPTQPATSSGPAAADAPADDREDDTPKASQAGTAKRGGSRRKGRPSVPSWDDIMFGARDQR